MTERTCTQCPAELTGRQVLYCSPRCAQVRFNLARIADGRFREYRQRNRAHSADYHRLRRAGGTGLATVACAACGAPTGRVEASEADRRRVCGTICRSYIQHGVWPTCPVPTPATPIERACGWCDGPFLSTQPAAWYCTHSCANRAREQRRRAREARSFGEWRRSDFMRIARKFNYHCAYCGTKPDRIDPDHVTALSRGGLNVIGNLLPACKSCNADKRDLTLEEWAAERQRLGKPPRATTWPDEDNRYWHLTATKLRCA